MGAKARSLVGTIYFGLLDGNKQLTGGYVKVGNVYPLKLKVETEQKTQTSRMRETYGQNLDTKSTLKAVTGSMDIHQWIPKTLAWGLMGEEVPLTGGSGTVSTPEAVVAVLDEFVRLGHQSVSSVVVERKNGADAADWSGTAAVSLGAYRVPTTPNDHFYKCTTAGTTASSEPTWPTNGTTVTDGTAVWQDMGPIVAVAGTDYNVLATLGMIESLSSGSIVDGETLEVTYSYAAQSGYQVNVGTKTLIRVAILIDGEDEYTGEPMNAEFYSVVLASGAEIGIISEPESDYEKLPFSLVFETPEGKTTPGVINGLPL